MRDSETKSLLENLFLKNNSLKTNAFNLFPLFAQESRIKESKTETKLVIKGRNLAPIKEVMAICEKYSTVIDEQKNFNQFYLSNVHKSNALKLEIVLNAIKVQKPLKELDKNLAFLDADLKKIDVALSEGLLGENDEMASFVQQYFELDQNPKQTIKMLDNQEVGTIVPIVQEITPVDYDEQIDYDNNFFVGFINNEKGRYNSTDASIPVASFKISETFNKKLNTNIPVNVNIFMPRDTIQNLETTKTIERLARQDLEDDSEMNTADKITASIYDYLLKDLRLKQVEILEIMKSRSVKQELLDDLKDKAINCDLKIKKLLDNNRPVKKQNEEKESLLAQTTKVTAEIKAINAVIERMKKEAVLIAKNIKIDDNTLSKLTFDKYSSVYEEDILNDRAEFRKKYNLSLLGLGHRLVYCSSVDDRTYILPQHIKAYEEGSLSVNLSLCPVLGEDTQEGVWRFELFNLDKVDQSAIDRQNKIFEDFVSFCEKLDFQIKSRAQSKVIQPQFYSSANAKVYIDKQIKDDEGNAHPVYGFEKIIRSLYAVIDAQKPKVLFQTTNPKLVEIASLRALEFMVRGVPNLETEEIQSITNEIRQKIIKKCVLINPADVPVSNALEDTTNLAIAFVRKAYTEMGVDITELPRAHSANGFHYLSQKDKSYSLADWFICPESSDASLADIQIKKTECLKVLSLGKFCKFEAYDQTKEKWDSMINEKSLKKGLEHDCHVQLAALLNRQLNALYEFSKRKQYTGSLKNLLADCTAQVISIIEQDKSGILVHLLNSDRNTDQSLDNITKSSLFRLNNEINKHLYLSTDNSKQKTTEIDLDDVKETKADLLSLRGIQSSRYNESNEHSGFDMLLNEMAIKLDYYLLTSGVNYSLNKDTKQIKSFCQDVVAQDSVLRQIVYKHTTGESEISLETEIMQLIQIKIGDPDINSKDVIRKVVSGICTTGYGVTRYIDKDSEKIINEIAKVMKKKPNEIKESVIAKFNVGDIYKKVIMIKVGGLIGDIIEKNILLYKQLEAALESQDDKAIKQAMEDLSRYEKTDKLQGRDLQQIIKKNEF